MADPSTATVFAIRWTGRSPLSGSVRSLISTRCRFGYFGYVAASRRANSLATGWLSTVRQTIHEGRPHAVSEISKINALMGEQGMVKH